MCKQISIRGKNYENSERKSLRDKRKQSKYSLSVDYSSNSIILQTTSVILCFFFILLLLFVIYFDFFCLNRVISFPLLMTLDMADFEPLFNTIVSVSLLFKL